MAAGGTYQVIARKWRPQAFDEVVGQEHITRTLRNAIASGRIGHAFLFIGSRGIGKTTTARILAKALNCLAADGPTAQPCGECENCTSIAQGNNMDVIEIDGASNNGVEDVREIRENIRLVPTRARYKIYIIDEVHQLSSGAFNALLKTLEEPPAHAVFVLATTEAHKIPATIISRCQRYDFRRVPIDGICQLLSRIVEAEGVTCSPEALQAIARAAEGGIRDAESILDQLMSYCGDSITFQDVFDVLGLVDWRLLHQVSDAIIARDVAAVLRIIEEVIVAGKDLTQFVQDILQYFRNVLVCKSTGGQGLTGLPEEEVQQLDAYAKQFNLRELIRLVEQFAELTRGFDSQIAQRIALESLLIRLCKQSVDVSVDTVLEKLMSLKEGGVAVVAAPAEQAAKPQPAPVAPAEKEPVQAAPPVVEEPTPPAAEEAAPSAAEEAAPPAAEEAAPPVAEEAAPPAAEEAAPPAVEEPAPPAAEEPAPSAVEKSAPPAAEEPQPVEQKKKPRRSSRAEVTPQNLRAAWAKIIEVAAQDSVTLQIDMSQAKPVRVDGGALVLEFPATAAKLRESLEKGAHREAVEAALNRLTTNVTTFRTEIREEEAAAPSAPRAGRVSTKEAQALLEDPHIAKVVDVFKGEIVEVRTVSGEKR